MRSILISIALSLTVTACFTDVSSPGGNGSDDPVDPPPGIGTGSDTGSGSTGGGATARVYFNGNVYPLLKNACGSSSCHSTAAPGAGAPAFVSVTDPATDESAAWTLITADAQVVGSFAMTAPLLSVPQNTAHYAKFSAAQVTTIVDWLSLEAQWRSEAGGTTPVDYMAQFSGCMTQTDFDTAQVAKAYAQQVNTNEGYCRQCHVNGQAQSYFIATPSSINMFNAVTTYREYMSTFFTVKDSKVVVNTAPFVLAADGGTNGQHPRNWNATDNKGMTAINTFYTAAAAKLAAGTCGTPTLTD